MTQNHLKNETSLYLMQHVNNPVNWYPWGNEAIQKAQKENKPIILSIGYSACHWCHVMEKESFENKEIAKIQNEHFISIKVDREERPDLDEIYMNAVQAMTGRGGWPLNVFLTPDLKPFYGGTYFPPADRMQMIGWGNLLLRIADYYKNHPDDLQKNQQKLVSHIEALSSHKDTSENLNDTPVKNLCQQLKDSFDKAYGGFGMPPKFPHATDLQFLLEYNFFYTDKESQNISLFTLEKMACGGIYDQLGGGFHRYSTDEKWLIPHYEKMLYDNALLLHSYCAAYSASQNEYFKNILIEMIAYLKREMLDEKGGFYSTQDADSEGEEGKFYVWSQKQIYDVLKSEQAEIFCSFYDVTEQGNFENGTSSPWITKDIHAFAKNYQMDSQKMLQILEDSKRILFREREKRIKPARDEKIITAWNGMVISGLAHVGFVLNDKSILDLAIQAKDFILQKNFDGKILYRTYGKDIQNQEQVKISGFLEDYAYFTDGLIRLFEATGCFATLSQAIELHELTKKYFYKDGSFYFTPENQKDVIVRSSAAYDSSVPSAQSLAISNAFRLGHILSNQEDLNIAELSLKKYMAQLQKVPRAYAKMIQILQYTQKTFYEIVIVGKKEDSLTQDFIKFFQTKYLPDKVFVFLDLDLKDEWQVYDAFCDKLDVKQPTVFVCYDHACNRPICNLKELEKKFT